MKIFFPIRAFYPSQVGGPSNTLYWHTCALYKKGIDINIVTTTWGIQRGLVKANAQTEQACGKVFYGKGTASSLGIIIKALAEIKHSDIVHLNSLFHGLSVACFFYARCFYRNKKIVWSVRGELSPEALRFGKKKKVALLSLYRRFNSSVVFHSTSDQETVDILDQFPEVKVIQVPNFLQTAERLSMETKKQFLFMGRIHPIKALDKLIMGLALSRHFISQGYKLVMVGTHTPDNQYYLDHLHRLIHELGLEEHIQFKGHVTGEDKEIAYAESYALILPSKSENFGNVVVEAMNQGTPVIASKGTPWSILERYKCGYHINNTPEEIAKALDKMILLNKDDYIQMRENATKLLDQEFNIFSKIDIWVAQYQSLLEI